MEHYLTCKYIREGGRGGEWIDGKREDERREGVGGWIDGGKTKEERVWVGG